LPKVDSLDYIFVTDSLGLALTTVTQLAQAPGYGIRWNNAK